MEKQKKSPFGTIDANENVRQEVQDIINTTAHAEQPAEEKKPAYSSYDDIYKMLSEQKAANDALAADADRRARLAKAHQMVGGIYDMGRAIANLYGTTQYAPNVDLESMSDKARERYEKALAERNDYKDAALNYALKGASLMTAKDKYEAEKAQKGFDNSIKAQTLEQTIRRNDIAEAQNKYKAATKEKELEIKKQDADTRAKNADTNDRRANAALAKAKRGESGYTQVVTKEIDPYTGKVTKVTTVKAPNGEKYRIVEQDTGTGNSGSGNNGSSKRNNGSMPGVANRDMPGVSGKN